MAKEQAKKLSPKEEMEIAIEAQKKIQASQLDKAPIMSNAIQSQSQTVYEHNPHIPEASMEKPKADFPEHLMGMAFRGSSIKAMNGFDPYEGYTKLAMDRYNIEQNRLNNTLQRLDSPEHIKTYTRMDTAKNQEAGSNQYQAQQVELEREKNEIMKEANGLKAKKPADYFDDKNIGVVRPYLTGNTPDEFGRVGWSKENVRNTLTGGIEAIKRLYPDVQVPDIQALRLDGSKEDNDLILSTTKFIEGYTDGAFALPWNELGIGFIAKKPRNQVSQRANAIFESMNNYSNVTGGRNTQPNRPMGQQPDKPNYSSPTTSQPQSPRSKPGINTISGVGKSNPSDNTTYRRDYEKIPSKNHRLSIPDTGKDWRSYFEQSGSKDAQDIGSKKKIPNRTKIIKVLDGDTYLVEDGDGKQYKVRASNFDTFESVDISETSKRIDKQSYEVSGRKEVLSRGKDAKRFADSLTSTNNPRIGINVVGTDKYGRTLSNVLVNGIDMRKWYDSLHTGKYITKYGDSFNKRK